MRRVPVVRTSFTLTAETAQLLSEIARRTGESKSGIVATAVWKHAASLGLVRPKAEDTQVGSGS